MPPEPNQMRGRSGVRFTDGPLYGGVAAKRALYQLDADLGSATMAVEEARESGQLTPAELRRIEGARKAIVRAARTVSAVREARGWADE